MLTDYPKTCAVDVSIEAGSMDAKNAVWYDDLHGLIFFDSKKDPAGEFHGRGYREFANGWVVDGARAIHDIARIVPLQFAFVGKSTSQAGKPSRFGFHASEATDRADFRMPRELIDEIGERRLDQTRGSTTMPNASLPLALRVSVQPRVLAP